MLALYGEEVRRSASRAAASDEPHQDRGTEVPTFEHVRLAAQAIALPAAYDELCGVFLIAVAGHQAYRDSDRAFGDISGENAYRFAMELIHSRIRSAAVKVDRLAAHYVVVGLPDARALLATVVASLHSVSIGTKANVIQRVIALAMAMLGVCTPRYGEGSRR